MNQNSRNKNYKFKIFLYLLIGIGFEIPAAYYCMNKIGDTRNVIYSKVGCSFLFMFFYLIHYSLKEYKRFKSTRLSRNWGTIFLVVFFVNIFDFCVIFREIILNDWNNDDPKKSNDFIFIIFLIISLTQSILTTIDFIITFVKFLYNLIRNHRINSEIQQDMLLAYTQNEVGNDNNRSINNEIGVGLISGSDFQAQNFQTSELKKFNVTNYDIIVARKEDEECTICLDFVMENSYENYPLKIPCGHYFHLICLNRLLSVNNKCPNCRKVIV